MAINLTRKIRIRRVVEIIYQGKGWAFENSSKLTSSNRENALGIKTTWRK